MTNDTEKSSVRDFWEEASAGEFWAIGDDERERLATEAAQRYVFEPYLPPFADFASGRDRDVLEIGTGMGTDHLHWARAAPRSLTGVDLSNRGVAYTRMRLLQDGFTPRVMRGDAERLPFPDNSFDLVYSWGVIHHSPDTPAAVAEIRRVLRPGGTARIMIYHTRSLTGYMLWARYGLMRFRPCISMKEIYARHLESPGTKAYSVAEAKDLFGAYDDVDIRIQLNYGDLLQSEVGRRHRGPLLKIAKALWPRPLLRLFCKNHGLYLLINARK